MRKFYVFCVLLVVGVFIYALDVAILIDTSRSIPKSEFEKVKEVAKNIAEKSVKIGEVTVVSFNDEPNFEIKSSKEVDLIKNRIDSINLGGNFTLLYDALVKTLNYFEENKKKGLIILISDGKDENSVTLIEDVARKAEMLKVPILSIGVGVEDKSLKRLPILTKGEYLGRVNNVDLGNIEKVVEKESEKEREEKLEEERKIKSQVKIETPQKEVKIEESKKNFIYFYIFVFLIGVIVVVLILVFFKRKREDRICEKCGRPLSLWETECPDCFVKKISDTLPGVISTEKVEEPKIELDPELFKKEPPSQDIDVTMVLEEVPVLLHLRGNQPPRVYPVSKNMPTTVGRDKKNNISIDDRTMSAQHFRIVHKDGIFYILDLNSTNGTFVDGERIKYKELKHGSQISAGQNQFIFRIEQKKLT